MSDPSCTPVPRPTIDSRALHTSLRFHLHPCSWFATKRTHYCSRSRCCWVQVTRSPYTCVHPGLRIHHRCRQSSPNNSWNPLQLATRHKYQKGSSPQTTMLTLGFRSNLLLPTCHRAAAVRRGDLCNIIASRTGQCRTVT